MKSHAPAARAFLSSDCVPTDDATKMVALLSYSIISEIAAFPSFTGITMSINVRFGLCSLYISMASCPFAASMIVGEPMELINSIGSPTIIEAANGQLAIDMYKEHKPNLTFIDIVMPVKDGNAAISEIMEYDSSATIFVASSVGTQSELKKALAAGACDFIQKPIDKDQVISLIKKRKAEGRLRLPT